MKKAILIGLPVLVLLLLVGWRYTQKTVNNAKLADRSKQARSGPANVSTAIAGPRQILQSLQAVGTVESPFSVELSPKLTGKIVYLEVREGASVKTGETLVRIDPTETEGQVLQAKAQLAQAQSNYISAKYNQHPANENVNSQIAQGIATLNSNKADYDQVYENFQDQVHQAHSAVLDTEAKVTAAKAATYNAEASLGSADASLADATAKANREYTLYKQGYVAAQDNDDAVAAKKVAEANVKVADGQVRAAKSAEVSAEQQEKSAEDNESIVKKTGQTNIRAALEKVKLAKAALSYAQATTNQKPAYVAQLKALQAAVDAAVGNVNQAEARLSDCNLVSTVDGTVTKRNADPGTVVNAGNSILEIQYLKWLFITTAVPVEYTGKIVKGTPVRVTMDALAGQTITGVVTDLSQSADPQSRQFLARIRLDNAAGKYRPGMYASVHFSLSEVNYPVVVPREAVHTSSSGNTTVTLVDKDNVAHTTPVTTGDQDTTGVVVTSGLNAGDKVVTLSYTAVRDGQKIVEGGIPKGGKKGGGGSGGKRSRMAPAATTGN